NINDVLANGFSFSLPMPGWKNSGIGSRNGGPDRILKYCRAQAITAPRMPTQAREVNWYPYSRAKTRLFTGVIRAAAGRGLRRVGLKPRN
ncbi:MAG: aldehyde dehydrogenase, partial [Dietzia sp.]|nr:aldehyde dehydrogenase [Dietzia sp.]